ncbi:thermonuclease family protein [Cyanobium gracile]|uniref:Micrococcal nuclease-like nuclease n=1 Tax=Cyanobium gracile (strain ATCC 27147 / PCC 6307) TaxID=292564 RepID=K9P8K9_CYAGP|nr:thermonuclease family protein [Cyanobium gracile]AFY29056.1 micrococcal nuclease-like nuclease [Cyanobium gracile PCC 6307]
MRLGPLLLLLLLVAPAQAATVRSIGDGDTLRVVEGGRSVTIRLACIDAPEKAQRPYGQASRAALMTLAPVGSEVSLRVKTTDRYGRTVAEVLRGGQNVNVQLLRQRQAFAYRQYLRQCDAAAYLGAERPLCQES